MKQDKREKVARIEPDASQIEPFIHPILSALTEQDA